MIWRERLFAYVGWAAPPLLGAALELPWWATLLLVVPATVWYLATLWRNHTGGRTWDWDRLPIVYAIPGIIVIALVVPGLSSLPRYAGCFAAALLIGADLLRGGRSMGQPIMRRPAGDAARGGGHRTP